jgi:hypothetical protein
VQSIEGVLIEVRKFIESLEVTSQFVSSDQSANFFMGEVDGRLPDDKGKMLKTIDRALGWWRTKGEPKRNPFSSNLNQPV